MHLSETATISPLPRQYRGRGVGGERACSAPAPLEPPPPHSVVATRSRPSRVGAAKTTSGNISSLNGL